ncbi:hypothetical protein NQ317_001059 [Molorchus minor]|uniref:Uncharacterized protein n=1 Tax=Molorchus minor TaxID=1323400 RepID=A0ABQ9JS86_9CUCU|nr:hypothetical protein NQ317_001059 [Molorchus minor]
MKALSSQSKNIDILKHKNKEKSSADDESKRSESLKRKRKRKTLESGENEHQTNSLRDLPTTKKFKKSSPSESISVNGDQTKQSKINSPKKHNLPVVKKYSKSISGSSNYINEDKAKQPETISPKEQGLPPPKKFKKSNSSKTIFLNEDKSKQPKTISKEQNLPSPKKFKKSSSGEAVSLNGDNETKPKAISSIEQELPAPRKSKKNSSNEMVSINSDKTHTDTTNMLDTVSKIQNNDKIENRILRPHIRHQIDEISDAGSKTSSDTIASIMDTSVCSMETQKALFKRNNLFKGVSKDKVCQHCLKPEEVLKCRGRCNGTYHVDCATKILKEIVTRGRRIHSNDNTSVQENESDSSIIECPNKSGVKNARNIFQRNSGNYYLRHSNNYVHTVNQNEVINKTKEIIKISDENNASAVIYKSKVIGKNEEVIEKLQYAINKIEDDQLMKIDVKETGVIEEDHVQIITVPSSVYNTPPRKTFPPHFKNMTLAEQIDYKMKEIMRKFEKKTFYSESSIDSSGSDNSVNNKSFSNSETIFPVDSTEVGIDIDQKHNQKSESKPINGLKRTILAASENELTIKNQHFKKRFYFDVEINKSPEIRLNTSDISTETSMAVGPKNFKCGFCISDLDPFCFVCRRAVSKKGSSIRHRCSLYQCGRFYHPECLKMWPQTQWSLIQTTKHKDSDQAVDSFVCPLHVCHTCVSDDPRAATSRCSSDKIVKCLRCPSSYHTSNLCVPAGTIILSSTQIVCPRHRDKNKSITINTTWCFLCSEGGNLICCETCPTSVHPECLPVNLTDDDKFICEDCESGRLPLYDEIVWVKLGKFRWWPALILFPNEIPANVMNIKHGSGEFVVKFFGTYDYYWMNRGKTFLFQEGDTGHCNSVRKKVDAAFNKAIEEAVIAHKLKKEFKQSQEAESQTSLKPPPYIKIKVNKPVGNVRQLDLDLSSTNACECNPHQPNPCGPDSDCLNRLLLTECNPDVCPAGKRCRNQSFDKREYPPLLPYKTQGRGWGLKALAPIKKGQFVIEYVGELIDSEEYQRRIQKMHEQKEENYYFLTIDKDRMIDAGPKGNLARFMNHCCQPNCETQKWTVNGDTRVGLFATVNIPADTELTFNYNLECVGKEKKVCRCGAINCSGFIGVKAKQVSAITYQILKLRSQRDCLRRKKVIEPIILPPCFVCGRKGNVGSCNNKVCNKAYHLKCLTMTHWPEGNKFVCPWHSCNICSKRTIRCCIKCISSFCPSHSEGNIRYDNLLGFVCQIHDPVFLDAHRVKRKRKNLSIVTKEKETLSTIPDDEDDMSLLLRFGKFKNKLPSKCGITTINNECVSSNSNSQDEDAVSSATLTDTENDSIGKKRKRPRESRSFKRKRKSAVLWNHNNTANLLFNDSLWSDSDSEFLSNRSRKLENH